MNKDSLKYAAIAVCFIGMGVFLYLNFSGDGRPSAPNEVMYVNALTGEIIWRDNLTNPFPSIPAQDKDGNWSIIPAEKTEDGGYRLRSSKARQLLEDVLEKNNLKPDDLAIDMETLEVIR